MEHPTSNMQKADPPPAGAASLLVVKVGGGADINLDALCDDLAALIAAGRRLVLVHGGAERTNEVAAALGHPPRFLTSPSGFTSRHTDRRALEIFTMVYAGAINKEMVARLQARGVNAVGLSGVDGGLWRGPRKRALRAVENGRQRIVRDSFTGRVTRVNAALLHSLLDQGYTPVLTPPALSNAGEAINVDGDRAAAATAAALGAERLLILSNVPGLLRDFPRVESLIPFVQQEELEATLAASAKGRMRIKLLGAREALDGGVSCVVIGDARRPAPVSAALGGAGTTISAAPQTEVTP